MTRRFLEHIRMDSFGAFSNRSVGPFSPGLNVVFGQNETGKTTVASFVRGVLFGWEEARGQRNTYKPENAERAGSLFFAARRPAPALWSEGWDIDEEDEDELPPSVELSRVRNADGLQGDASVIADLDRETFRTMFFLTSDELRSLRNTTDVTAKLLTAGSGTGSSPAHALSCLQERLAGYTSRASGASHSLANLAAEQDELRLRIAEASDEVERLKREDREFSELEPQRDAILARIDEVNASIDDLTAARTTVKSADEDIAVAADDVTSRLQKEETLRREHAQALRDCGVSDRLLGLSPSEERKLRDRIETLAAEEAKCEHAVELAQDNYSSSKAAYEALIEAEGEGADRRASYQRTVQIALSVVMPFVFVAAGVPVFMHGRSISSLSFTALGSCLIMVAVVMACAALVVLLRPNKAAEAREDRKRDAHWVMLQDRKKLQACQENQEAFRRRAEATLADAGLGEAQGVLRRARAMLDDAKEARSQDALFKQRRQAAVSRRTSLEESLEAAKDERRQALEGVGLGEGDGVEEIDDLLDQKAQQRSGLLKTSERINRRYGELEQELSAAVDKQSFDELKLRYQEVLTRQDDSARDFARLLLAKRMLEAAVSSWESKSQPEVYRQASRLLASMTGGRWVKVGMTSEGRLQVEDSTRVTRDPSRLSLGTCQQLYLALRIALLLTADNVGRSVPILADDILVNFDTARRASAAAALAELARERQVILFTCHEEVVEALRAADQTLNEVHL